MTRLGLQDGPEDAAPEGAAQPGGVSSQPGVTAAQDTEERQEHPAYPDLPPEVPRDEQGIRKYLPLVVYP